MEKAPWKSLPGQGRTVLTPPSSQGGRCPALPSSLPAHLPGQPEETAGESWLLGYVAGGMKAAGTTHPTPLPCPQRAALSLGAAPEQARLLHQLLQCRRAGMGTPSRDSQ